MSASDQAVDHFIAGKRVAGASKRSGERFNPATGAVIGSVPFADEALVDLAVESAHEASLAWRDSTLGTRARILFRYRDLVERHRGELAELVTTEHGKTLPDAAGEVARGLEVLEFACGIPELLKGGYAESVATHVDTYSLRQAVGVAVGITPFNFPVMVPMWMFPLAIACGNAFVLKPSEKDPSASVRLAELFSEAGLPDGVMNVVHGDKVAVDRLVRHPKVAAVSFVGSTPIARYVYSTATAANKRVQALGGAKNHLLVLPDADLDLAADAAVSAGFGSAGERCMAISVVAAVEPVADPLVGRIAERMASLSVGGGAEHGTDMGPLVTAQHRDRVASYLDAGVAEGATLVVDGRSHEVTAGPGFFLGPSLFDRVTSQMSIYTDEIFGPVLAVVRVPSYEAGLELINSNRYGNGTAIFTNDGGAARRFQHEVQVGMIGVNVPIPVPVATFAFGGWKESLFGDTHIYGADGVHFYTRGKVVTSRWLDPSHGGVNLGFPSGG